MKIASLEIENVKRVKAVSMQPSPNGLTIIGGRNGQGKTSVLDAIAWALGGDRFKPSQPMREGSAIPPHLKVTLDNGLIVERSGKNSSLKVIDPSGNKGGQQLLNEFVEQFALDLPRFIAQSSADKAKTLLRIIGVGEQLYTLEQQERALYNERHAIGQIAEQKKKYAAEITTYDGVPDEPVSASELIRQQQEILAVNAENQRKRRHRDDLNGQYLSTCAEIEALSKKLTELEERRDQLAGDLKTAQLSAQELTDQSTSELEQSIRDVEQINAKIRANLEHDRAEDEAKTYSDKYDAMTGQLEKIRAQRMELLNNADLPLPGLSVNENHELTYNGAAWDCMSGSDQLKVSCAIVRKLNPKCGFVLMDKLEQMDAETLTEFGGWLEAEGLQVIATRVSTGGECSILIDDGYSIPVQPETVAKSWKAGEF